MPPACLGVDFSSAPSRRKPIVVAHGRRLGNAIRVDALEAQPSFAGFEALLKTPGPWLGAFDFPFGLPREFVAAQRLGDDIDTVMARLRTRCVDRMAFRNLIDQWGNGRIAGQRLIHRRCDRAVPGVTSTSPLQTRYVPVGFMFFEGLGRLVDAGVSIPGMRDGDSRRVALEAYPRLLAHELIGARSYKNKDDAQRRGARCDIVAALEEGRTRLALRLEVAAALRTQLIDDAAGDCLDAALCLMQAGWASGRRGYGLPAHIDPVEGWIVSAQRHSGP